MPETGTATPRSSSSCLRTLLFCNKLWRMIQEKSNFNELGLILFELCPKNYKGEVNLTPPPSWNKVKHLVTLKINNHKIIFPILYFTQFIIYREQQIYRFTGVGFRTKDPDPGIPKRLDPTACNCPSSGLVGIWFTVLCRYCLSGLHTFTLHQLMDLKAIRCSTRI